MSGNVAVASWWVDENCRWLVKDQCTWLQTANAKLVESRDWIIRMPACYIWQKCSTFNCLIQPASDWNRTIMYIWIMSRKHRAYNCIPLPNESGSLFLKLTNEDYHKRASCFALHTASLAYAQCGWYDSINFLFATSCCKRGLKRRIHRLFTNRSLMCLESMNCATSHY